MIVTSIVLSFAQGTFHPYYTASIAPGIAGLVGVGTWTLWRARQQWTSRLLLAAAVAATGAWSFTLLDRTPSWYPWLRVVVAMAAVAATVALLIRRALVGRMAIAVATCGLVAVLGGPAAFAAVTATIPQSGGQPTAGPAVRGSRGGNGGLGRLGAFGGSAAASGRRAGGFGGGFGGFGATNARLASLLKASHGYRWAAAVQRSSAAAGLELASDTSVMAIGGFTGRDPAPTLTQFENDVHAGRVHYFIGAGQTGGGGFGGFGGRSGGPGGTISTWVQQHYKATTIGGEAVYDLTAPATASSAGPARSST